MGLFCSDRKPEREARKNQWAYFNTIIADLCSATTMSGHINKHNTHRYFSMNSDWNWHELSTTWSRPTRFSRILLHRCNLVNNTGEGGWGGAKLTVGIRTLNSAGKNKTLFWTIVTQVHLMCYRRVSDNLQNCAGMGWKWWGKLPNI
jgi:hypothetical protein